MNNHYTPSRTEIKIPRKLTGQSLTKFARALYGDESVRCYYNRLDREWMIDGDGLDAQSIGRNKDEAKVFLMSVLDSIETVENTVVVQEPVVEPVKSKEPEMSKPVVSKESVIVEQLRINGRLLDIVATQEIAKAMHLVRDAMSRQFNRIGLVTGETGTGKTVASYYIAARLNGSRICCYPGMTKKDLVIQIAYAAGNSNPVGSYGQLIAWLKNKVDGQLFLIDEANHIGWQHMEVLRFLADETGATVILFGTQLLSQTMQERRTAPLLAQLTSRIGAKNITFEPLPASGNEGLKQIEAYFIKPNFGTVGQKSVARVFQKATKGYWRLCRELTEACQFLMSKKPEQYPVLSKEVVETAASFLAKS
jgi:DNA transposition AAA+ family ATPase